MPQSTMPLLIGTLMPDFSVWDVMLERWVSSSVFDGQPVVIAFMCNHCPYVQRILRPWIDMVKLYQKKNIGFLMVSSNDIARYPQDSPDNMVALVKEKDITCSYCYDENQLMAKAFQAKCTPEFFVYDEQKSLVYHGCFDRSANGETPNGEELSKALDALLMGGEPIKKQYPSLGCSIKWIE
ncbi:MAG: thioredoxin family protein [Candidatus Comchoanobacterales bacterium]